jgi:hypothetical protein
MEQVGHLQDVPPGVEPRAQRADEPVVLIGREPREGGELLLGERRDQAGIGEEGEGHQMVLAVDVRGALQDARLGETQGSSGPVQGLRRVRERHGQADGRASGVRGRFHESAAVLVDGPGNQGVREGGAQVDQDVLGDRAPVRSAVRTERDRCDLVGQLPLGALGEFDEGRPGDGHVRQQVLQESLALDVLALFHLRPRLLVALAGDLHEVVHVGQQGVGEGEHQSGRQVEPPEHSLGAVEGEPGTEPEDRLHGVQAAALVGLEAAEHAAHLVALDGGGVRGGDLVHEARQIVLDNKMHGPGIGTVENFRVLGVRATDLVDDFLDESGQFGSHDRGELARESRHWMSGALGL